MSQIALIAYTLIWMVILGGLVFAANDFVIFKTCNCKTGEQVTVNEYVANVIAVKRSEVVWIINHAGRVHKRCTGVYLRGAGSRCVIGSPSDVLRKIDPAHEYEEEEWQ